MSSYGLWLSAAGMKVQDHRQSVFANNMANSNTTGFKQDLAVVLERPVETREDGGAMSFANDILDRMGGGLNVRKSHHDFTAGSIETTDRPLDVAIEHDGFFTVSDGNVTRYTRDGQFSLNTEGDLVMTAGQGRWRVLDDGGATIQVDPNGEALTIKSDGTIRQGEIEISKIGVAMADDPQLMKKSGENLFDSGDAEMTLRDANLVPGAREASNVDVMKGLISMIEAGRAYQMNANLIQMQDKMTGQAISSVGRVV